MKKKNKIRDKGKGCSTRESCEATETEDTEDDD